MTTRIDTQLPTGYRWQVPMSVIERICREGRARQAAQAEREAQELQAIPDDGKRKRCNRCRMKKPLAAFPGHTTNRDGLDGRCKRCKAKYDRDRMAKQVDAVMGAQF